MNIYVTGIGAISAIGFNTTENYQSLQSGNSGIAPAKYLSFNKKILAGEVKLSNDDFIRKLALNNQPYSRTSLLGIAAAKEAWGKNSLNKKIRQGIISATSVGGMDNTEKYYRQFLGTKESADISLITTHDSGNTTEKIANELGIHGYINTLSTACSSGANAIMLASRLISSSKYDRMIAGGSDALTQFTVNGFNSLMIYDTEWCRPFDENRNGLNLGEGAAFLVLESERSLEESGNTPICKITGWHNAADAYHQTASSPDGKGATLAMENALIKAGITKDKVSYINAHGTGTKNNDLSESVALKNIFGDQLPPFSSTKSFTGHTLAAAGAIEAVFSVMAITNNVLLPNLNFEKTMSETALLPQTKFEQSTNIKTVLSNSFGFGGNNTSLVFEKI